MKDLKKEEKSRDVSHIARREKKKENYFVDGGGGESSPKNI